MTFKLEVLNLADAKQFKIDAQDAFQKGFEEYFGKSYSQILPESDIDNSLGSNGAIAYKAILDGTMVGGAIVVVDIERKHGSLDLLLCEIRRTRQEYRQEDMAGVRETSSRN